MDLGTVPDGNQHPGIGWRELFAAHGVTQADMAERTHTSPKHINHILRGRALPSVTLIVRMAYELDHVRLVDHDDGRKIAKLMWQMQGRYVLDHALSDESERRRASDYFIPPRQPADAWVG